MDSSSWLQLAIFIILVILGAYFAGSESSFSAMNKIRIKTRAEDGDKRAKKALYIANNFEKAITTLLIGNNITHIAAASVSTVFVAQFWDIENPTVSVLCTVITTGIVFLFSEMIPKAFANDRYDTMSMACASSLRMLMKILSPIVAFFSLISNAVSKLFAHEEAPSITEEELYDIIDTIEEEGVMDEEQSNLFKSALDFSETTAKDVMTVKADICAVEASSPNEEVVKLMLESNHSRIPVYRGSIDNIVGILHIRSFLKEYSKNKNIDLNTLLTEVFYVSSDSNIDDLLSVMRKKKVYLAIVTDKQDNTAGIVTIEDFLEELVGEIWDEDDVIDNDFLKLGGNRYMVSTHLTIADAFNRMSLPCPEGAVTSMPIISWVIETFGKLPEEGDSFHAFGFEVTVEEIVDGKIENVIIQPEEQDNSEEDPDVSDDGKEASK